MDGATIITRFAELFCGRRDRFGLLLNAETGVYSSEARPLTDDQYRRHRSVSIRSCLATSRTGS
jgi:hypothetical protein